jgi:hypothetical protein
MTQFEPDSPNVIAEDFGGEIVAIHLESGRYYSLRGLAQAVWTDLGAGHASGAIEQGVAAVNAELGAATAAFIVRLQAEGLIRARTVVAEVTSPPASLAAAKAGAAKPELESFDDMADLIKADPIHEVDEAFGWPIRREQ